MLSNKAYTTHYYLLYIVYYLIFTIYYILLFYLVFITYCELPIAYWLLITL